MEVTDSLLVIAASPANATAIALMAKRGMRSFRVMGMGMTKSPGRAPLVKVECGMMRGSWEEKDSNAYELEWGEARWMKQV